MVARAAVGDIRAARAAGGPGLACLALSRPAERLPVAPDVCKPGELPVGLDYQPVHLTQLAEQPETGAVVTDRYRDEAVVGVVARHVGHVDAADGLGVQLHHEGHRLSAVCPGG